MYKRTYPKISIASIVQRANDLVSICRADRIMLEMAGLQWDLVEQVAILLKECSDADAKYQIAKENMAIERDAYNKFLLECNRLRTNLANAIRISFNSLGIKIHLPQYYKNRAHSDLVQDLNDLACVCNNNREDLEKVKFDFKLSDRAGTIVPELSNYIAKMDLARESAFSELFENRNVIYENLYSKIKEICMMGRKAFQEDSIHRKYYKAIK